MVMVKLSFLHYPRILFFTVNYRLTMNLTNELEECCVQIESNKISERKKYCDRLSKLLENEDLLALLNEGRNFSWKQVISALQECLRKDADKIMEDTRKKGSMSIKYPSSDLFLQVIKTTVKEAPDELNVSSLVGYILGCMKISRMRKCYDTMFLLLLKDYVLVNSSCRGKISSDNWIELFKLFKQLYEEHVFENLVIKCLMLLIKWGPTEGFPPSLLREEFEFFTKLCFGITKNSPSNQQEDMLDISYYFSNHMAKDNRVSCCKYGEDVILNLTDLYELNGREAKVKKQLVNFFLLQVTIHHPYGVLESHPCAYAFNWSTWKKSLKVIYNLLCKEINFYFTFRHKNSSFFITNNESAVLSDDFCSLFVEVSRQMFVSPDLDVSMSLDSTSSLSSQKRQRVEVTLQAYITNIQNSKNWVWIHIVRAIIQNYPDLLNSEDYLILLQILSALQIESNDHYIIINIYNCLAVLLDIENKRNADGCRDEVEKLWKTIGESTLRAFGLNQHKEVAEKVLKRLIARNILNLDFLLQSYTSGVFNTTVQSIETLNILLKQLCLPPKDDKKNNLMLSILSPQNSKDYNYLLHPITAKFLVNLILKQWPDAEDEILNEVTSDKYSDIKDIYFKSALERPICVPLKNKEEKVVDKIYNLDPENLEFLSRTVHNFVESLHSGYIEQLLSITVLLVNITNYIVEYKILKEGEIHEFLLVKLVDKILNYDTIKNFEFFKEKSDREMKRMLECVTILDKTFSFCGNKVLVSKIKDIIPFDLLKTLVAVLNELHEDQERKSQLKFNLKKCITKALSSYCCASNTDLNRNQSNILAVLAAPNYNCMLEEDYKLLLTFLYSLKKSKVGILEDTILSNVLKSVEEMCIARYHCSENAIEILTILNQLYPHFATSNVEDYTNQLLGLLKTFYEKHNDYGPDVNKALLNCIGNLIQNNPRQTFSCGMTAINCVPNFLCSDYQEIRFKAVEVLIIFFHEMSKSKLLADFHKQEEIFSKMYEKSLEVFTVTGEITQERRTDEIITRTASVLHTFASLILCCNNWIEEALYALVKLTYIKNLGSVNKILTIVNNQLHGNNNVNCMEIYLDYILEKWINELFNINDFPFNLFDCKTKLEFYHKYFDICVPLLIVTDRKDLIIVAKEKGINEKEIVEKSCPKIFGVTLCRNIENMEMILTTNKILIYYVHVVSLEGLKNCLMENLDQLLLSITRYLTDEKYIWETFREVVIFPQKHLTVRQYKDCIHFMENFLCEGQNLIKKLMDNDTPKFEKILLMLKLNVHNSFTTDSKLKSFHHYTVWIDIILNNLKVGDKCQYFFIRDTVYTLINLIANNKEETNFIAAVSRFMDLFLRNILPKFSDTFEEFLIFTVNSLKNFISALHEIAEECLKILYFLVVQNACQLMNTIEKLDKFPIDAQFDSIREVHTKIKYENREASLEQEINFFLEHKDISTRQDSLVHLRNVLSKEKHQLMTLYEKLEKIRGFLEDCEKSLLHRLIVMLAKMSGSANENIRFEAIKCLGELGPSNLTTLVLQPEKEVLDIKCTPFELLTGHILSIMSEYIIDPDINIVKTTSEMLYFLLNCKEGKKVLESEENFGYGKIEKRNFMPYFPKTKTCPTSNVTVQIDMFRTNINDDELWCGNDSIAYEKWIVSLVSSILKTFTNKSYLPKLITLCKIAPKLCERLLPLLVNLLLHINDKNINKILCDNINGFFSRHWDLTIPKCSKQYCTALDKKSVKCMLNVVSFVRLQKSYAASSKMRQCAELDLNYLKVAKAAEFCAAHFTALLYSELWCQHKLKELEELDNGKNSEYLIGTTMLDYIFENEEEYIGEALQNILRNAFKAIGDVDALLGCGVQFLLKPQFRVEHYKELGHWDQVTQFYEMRASHGDNSAKKYLMESLKKCGLYQLPLLCSNQTDDSQYECLWRLGQWNAMDKHINSKETAITSQDFEKYRFFALKALHENNDYAFGEAKKLQGLCVIEQLRHTSLESSQNIYPILTQLQALNELEDFADAVKSKNFIPLLTKWKLQEELIRTNDFQYVEPVIAQRTVLLMDYLKLNTNETLKNYFVTTMLDFANLAKEECQFHIAATGLNHLEFMPDLTDNIRIETELMDAQISWLNNNKLVARRILNKLCKHQIINPKLQSAALKLSGQYMCETFSENRLTIIRDYFIKSITIMTNVEKSETDYNSILDTYDKIAQFADKGYQQIVTYMKSDLFQKKVVNMEKSKETASKMQMQRKKTKDECIAESIHVKQSNIDAIEIETAKKESNQFLKIALRYYFLNLKHTDKNNIRIFRIMGLLLENKNNPIISEIHKEMLSTYKYITMLPQLVPHITENNTDFYSKIANEIVEKCAIDHPHHTLPLLLSLANAHKDREFSETKTNTSSNDARMSAATNILEKLKRNANLSEHIDKLQQLCHALIELAYYKADNVDERKKIIDIPRNLKIIKIKNFENVLLPTYNLTVSKTCEYSSIVGITSFENSYHFVGGINQPKRIICRGTDGIKRSQLLKGSDDLRQDAVMQQVFTIMNSLLSANKQTKNLLIRTYKIVPLSMRSGILEWVDNSMPIGDYLVGVGKEHGAHQMYRPHDKSPSSCKAMIKNSAGKSSEERLNTFMFVCQKLKPIFHKFFVTFFPHPTIWYERRRAYIHSVATSSMCGYILGIGDRHVSNILIDKTTAEVIHIDFGIAFEQGRVLPTPETVPFRLTRDIVDGMGVSGVEGIFRRSCEKTMEVLRQNSQTIITILEVLLYDPLYVWTVTSAEANKRQTDDENELRNLVESEEENTNVNITAERALLRLREKLQGTELGHPTSIEHQVSTLIQQAMDPANLCKLFYGWQAFL